MRIIDSLVSYFSSPASSEATRNSSQAIGCTSKCRNPFVKPYKTTIERDILNYTQAIVPVPAYIFVLLLGILPSVVYGQETEIGWANYYADNNQGKQTAYGEIYDRNQFTCAHPEYPIGTLLRITRLDNHHTVVVRVNDKGPHTEGFLITLSMGAATAINMATTGKARVLVEQVALTPSNPITSYDNNPDANYMGSKGAQPSAYAQLPNDNYPSPAPNQSYYGQQTPGFSWNDDSGLTAKSPQAYENTNQPIANAPVYYSGFTVQLGAFANPVNAEHQLELIRKLGVSNAALRAPAGGNPVLYKINAGSFATRAEAEAFKKTLLQKFRLTGFIVEL